METLTCRSTSIYFEPRMFRKKQSTGGTDDDDDTISAINVERIRYHPLARILTPHKLRNFRTITNEVQGERKQI